MIEGITGTRGAVASFAVTLALAIGMPGTSFAEDADRRAESFGHRGALDHAIVDSASTLESERKLALARGFPKAIIDRQALVDVTYLGFDGKVHQGQLMVDSRLAGDIRRVFRKMLDEGFPIASAVPISRFGWDDTKSMDANNSSGFNYRKIKGKDVWSNHAFGQAVDIDPVQNPYINGRHVSPKGARYNPAAPGTFVKGAPLVELFKSMGWTWGGDWTGMKDYQHFEKVLR